MEWFTLTTNLWKWRVVASSFGGLAAGKSGIERKSKAKWGFWADPVWHLKCKYITSSACINFYKRTLLDTEASLCPTPVRHSVSELVSPRWGSQYLLISVAKSISMFLRRNNSYFFFFFRKHSHSFNLFETKMDKVCNWPSKLFPNR